MNNLKSIKRLSLMALGFISMMLTGCIVVADYEYGPHGNDGRAYFGVDYDHFEPYSYWDNNFSTPDQMWYGEMYRSQPGTYDFEYFINEDEYWYGTYSLYVNAGQPGQPYNQPGLDGEDTNLLLICNYNGFYFESWETCNCLRSGDDQHQVIEMTQGKHNFKIEMWKTNVRDRAPKGTNKMKGI